MTSLERARRFLQNRSRAIALTTVPLACLTVVPAPLVSSAIFEQAPCVTTTSGGSSFSDITCDTSQLPAGAIGVTGVKLTGSGTAVSNGGFTDILFTTQGPASGSFTGDVPVSYDFMINDPSRDPIDWDVFFSAFGDPNSVSNSADGVSTGGEVTGTFNVALDGSQLSQYVLHLNVMFGTSKEGDTITVTIPDNSIDVSPVPGTSTVPEPNTLSLFACAGAAFGLLTWFRRKKQNRATMLQQPRTP
jgi:hypothetical protein